MGSARLVLVVALLTFAPLLHAQEPPCPGAAEVPSITFCTPADGATLTSPFEVVAWAKSSVPVRYSQLYVNGSRVREQPGSQVQTSLTLQPGSYRLTAQSKDQAGVIFKKTINVTVAAPSGGCVAQTAIDPSVTICSPRDGETVATTFRLMAAAHSSSPVRIMQVYIDGARTLDLAASSINTELTLTPGAHRITVQAKNSAGTIFKKSVNITVANASSACPPPSSAPAINICSPADGAELSGSFEVSATALASTPVRLMQIYVDGVRRFEVAGSSITHALELTLGVHRVTVQAKDSNGVFFKKSVSVTVVPRQGTGISVTPDLRSVGLGLSASFAANTAAVWKVDGIAGGDSSVGTITPEGIYTAPLAPGEHTITAHSIADPNVSDSATVRVATTGVFRGVFTHHYDNERSGANIGEAVLTKGNVNQQSFGKLFSHTVDGFIFGQPLYVPNLEMPGVGTRNVVYVATMHNSVYAFDADGRSTAPLWQRTLMDPSKNERPMTAEEVGTPNSGPEVGITGTPVIDPGSGTIYLVTALNANGNFTHRLHALDIRTGADRQGSPVTLNPTYPGVGEPNTGNGTVVFWSQRQNQRAALLLANGKVYVAWGSHHTIKPWHGWLVALNAATLQQLAVFNSSPDTLKGGIWQSGGGPAADDAGNIYFATGQGDFNIDSGGKSYGDSCLKIARDSESFTPTDYFTPFDEQEMATLNYDMAAAGPLLLPDQPGAHPHLMVCTSKNGNIYLIDRDNMGGFRPTDDGQIVQALYGAVGALRGTPVYWNRYVYFAGSSDVLKAFRLSNGLLSASPVSKTAILFDARGAAPAVSSDGVQDGIIWFIERLSGNAVLHAFDASDLTRQLYSSAQNPARDAIGVSGVKFAVPTIANGKVYVPAQGRLVVYGLLPPAN